MKTFSLLILICSILDIGISKLNKHFLVETNDIADGDEVGIDYEEQQRKRFTEMGWVTNDAKRKLNLKKMKLDLRRSMKESFDEKDKDGSGTISVEEAVGKGSWDQWIKLKTEEEKKSKANTKLRKWVEFRTAWVKDHDKNGDGVLQFNEFWDIYNNRTEEQTVKDRKRSFNQQDLDDNGTISVEEYVREPRWSQWKNLKTEEERKSEANTKLRKYIEKRTAWVKDHDKDGDGAVNFTEFQYSYWDRQTEASKEKNRRRDFNSKDWDDNGTLIFKEYVGQNIWNDWEKLDEKERKNPKDNLNQLRKEIIEDAKARFKKDDKNGDSVLEFNEFRF